MRWQHDNKDAEFGTTEKNFPVMIKGILDGKETEMLAVFTVGAMKRALRRGKRYPEFEPAIEEAEKGWRRRVKK